jgi:hypothetical protein
MLRYFTLCERGEIASKLGSRVRIGPFLKIECNGLDLANSIVIV